MSIEQRFKKQYDETKDITPPKDLTIDEKLQWENMAIKFWIREVK